MRCHYEVLNLSQDAEESEIKSAYKKLALKWHPDKNLDNPENAKIQFQEVQQAYEVLSDRQERAWYDSHREQILHGSNKEFQDNCLDVFQYYTSSCYKGFNDDPEGFYAVYRNVFEQISKEDLEHIEDKQEFCDIPQFGYAGSDYEEVVKPFYSYWMSYSTKRSYVWLDPYNINEIGARKLVRLVDKENKKVRMKAKKERNEEVRNLVAFVKKRDKRVQENAKLLEEKAKENKKKSEDLRKAARKERREQMSVSATRQGEWTKFDNLTNELHEIEKSFMDQESDNSEMEDLYCVACNKVFKTPKTFLNHESSKKHKENLQILRDSMIEEEQEHLNSNSNQSVSEDNLSEEETNVMEKNHEKSKRSFAESHKNDGESEEPESEENVEEPTEEEEVLVNVKTKKSLTKKLKKSKIVFTIEDSDEDIDLSALKSTKGRRRKSSSTCKEVPEGNLAEVTPAISAEIEKPEKQSKKTKKKPQKTEKTEQEIDLSHVCQTCKHEFASKNKLFDHLKKTSHGVYLGKEVTNSKTVKNKSKTLKTTK